MKNCTGISNVLIPFTAFLLFAGCADVRTTYYKSGNIESEIRYENDKKNGKAVYYEEHGYGTMEMTYENDKPVGVNKSYDRNGELLMEYDNDTGIAKDYSDDGSHYETGRMVERMKNGLWKEYNTEDKLLLSEFTYVDGLKNGPTRMFREDGTVASSGFFTNGVPDGTWTHYDIYGKPLWKEVWTLNADGKSSTSQRYEGE